ncbi:MAG: GNAT family N-acetyltransferase [Mariprofundales bacterium]
MVPAQDCAPHLRHAVHNDLATLTTMAANALPEAWPLEIMAESLRLDHQQIMVAEENGVPAGYLLASLAIPDEIELLQLVVAANSRRTGMGTMLVQWLCDQCPPTGRILLEVRASNRPAIALYHHLGFHPLTTRHHYYRPTPPSTAREDALVMEFRPQATPQQPT